MSAPKITVIGTGYLGATHAICMAVLGFDVLGVELAWAQEQLRTAADVVVLLTEWTEFREIDPAVLGDVVAQRKLVDGRHALDLVAYRALGRP